MFQTKVVEEIKTYIILCSESVFFFRKSCRFGDNVEKYCKADQATVDGMAQAHCILDNQSYTHTLRICNTYCFPAATLVARRRLNATLNVHFLSCYCVQLGTFSLHLE